MLSVLAAATPEPLHARTAAQAPREIRIGRIDLARALRLFSRQTNQQVAFSSGIVRGKMSMPVVGRLDPTIALARLLNGTGLAARAVDGGYLIMLVPPVAAPRPLTTTPAPAMPADPEIVVIGTRLDGGEATDVRRRSLQSVSVLTDAQIRNLPDTSLADIVRRIPGIQISPRAAGGIITIRGLSQIEDRLNGRNLTSTLFRGFDIAALPADIVSGIDVYKTPSASQIEGGIGGVIDFHTRRPFDAEGSQASLSARIARGDLDDRARAYVSGHLGGRTSTAVGELGLLLGASRQAQDVGGDIFRTDTNLMQTTADGEKIDAPANAIKRYLRGTKTLTTGYVSAQWRPDATVEITGDLLYNRSALDFTNTSLRADLGTGEALGPFDRVPGRVLVRAGRWSAVPLTASASRGRGYLDVYQYGLGGRYRDGSLTVLLEGSHTQTRFRYGTATLSLGARAPMVDYAISGGVPRFTVVGADPAQRDLWTSGAFGDIALADDNRETAARLDGSYSIGGLIDSIKLGVRIARRTVMREIATQSAPAPSMPAVLQDGAVASLFGSQLFDEAYPQPRWIAPAASALRGERLTWIRTAFALAPDGPAFRPDARVHAVETIASGYAEATFDGTVGGISIAGNAGFRYATTDLSVGVPGGEVFTPPMVTRSYGHLLPSINVRAELGKRLYLRVAGSRQITRPAFTLLAPTVTIDFVNAVGEAGNPRLDALRATQLDAALEWYFKGGGSLYGALFFKDVAGFIRTQATTELIDGRAFLISRPVNADDGWVGGVEIGYAQRLTFLPGALGGLGVEASYTGIGSFAVDNGAGYRVRLEQMSRHNYTLSAQYERDGTTGGVSWIWRSRILQVSRGDELGRPLYRDPYGQLDANLRYPLTSQISVTASVLNALKRRTTEYYANRAALNQVFVESRRVLLGLTVQFGASP
ncbi:TonB-dependent receptor [uncultured Sphingomonas sp.]|uniref:TonB-dependent receptor n=1 Tax=uncultured Sphingomonas sp. TaxID=158754 RepID=UPI00262FCA7F|nr:TonB-dependent receptor [uncultured Sphingomonas sp.]